jgi:hypothetical protein
MIFTVWSVGEPDVLVNFTASGSRPPAQPSPDSLAHESSRKKTTWFPVARVLFCRGNQDCSGERSVGASRRVRRGPSLGGMTPAGAIEPRHTER